MDNFGTKLIQGDMSLVITYWVYAVLVPNVGLYLSIWLLLVLTDARFADVIVIVGHYSYAIYYIFISVSLWQSAKKYTGEKMWPFLALLSVLLWNLLTVASLIFLYNA